MRYTRISADCHIDMPWLPAGLFTSNASAAIKDRMPFVTDGPDGQFGHLPKDVVHKITCENAGKFYGLMK
jgi:hypothetical protein